MGFNEFVPPKCSVCGKFIGFIDFMKDEVKMEYTPDSEYTDEDIVHTHIKCYNNGT